MTAPVDVLVAGAGPAGLTLALQAHALGARVRVIERRPQPFRPSRALIVHPRTLEVLRPLGVVEAVLARADTVPRVSLHVGNAVVDASLGDLGWRDTPYPHLTLVRQNDLETVLAEALAERGVPVERGVELLRCVTGRERPLVEVVLRAGGATERMLCRWIAGCDGTDSTVRELTGLTRRETGYRQEILLADVALAGSPAPDRLHVHAGRRGLCFLFPQGEQAPWRLLLTQPAGGPAEGTGRPGPPPGRGELQTLLTRSGVPARITEVAWSTRLGARHGVARAYRRGPLFLAGDAAHVHSPAGGLGMNVGIQDAVNLGWKLALAPRSTDPQWLLDSYQEERRPVALRTRRLTNLIFHAEAGVDPVAEFARGTVLPLAAPMLPALLHRRRLLGAAVRLLSRPGYTYRHGSLSAGAPHRSGTCAPGDRLPDGPVEVGGRTVRLHELTAVPGVHLLLDRDAPEPATDDGTVHCHRVGSRPGRGVQVVRPDGYAGPASVRSDDPAVAAWLARIGVRVTAVRAP